MFSIKIDGVELGNIITLTDVKMSALPVATNTIKTYPLSNGGILTNKQYQNRTIKLEFVMRGEVDKKWELFTRVLGSKQLLKLTLGNFPNRYYTVTTDGDSTYNRVNKFYATGEVSFMTLDPFAYSDNERHFINQGNIITIRNDGTALTYPRFTFTASRDYKMIGFTHPNGRLVQYGYASLPQPVIYAGQAVSYDCGNNHLIVANKRDYISEGRPFYVEANSSTQIGFKTDTTTTQPITATIREAWQ